MAKRPARLPVVLKQQEVKSIFGHLSGTLGLMVRLVYGTGMRIMEWLDRGSMVMRTLSLALRIFEPGATGC